MNDIFKAVQNRDGQALSKMSGSDAKFANSDNVVNINAERILNSLFRQLKQLFPAAEQTNLKTPEQENAAKQQWIAAFAEGGMFVGDFECVHVGVCLPSSISLTRIS